MIPGIDPYAAVRSSTVTAAHPICRAIRTGRELATFLESHVFVVWSEASLLAALRGAAAAIDAAGGRPRWPVTARAATDRLQADAVPLYVEAMREVGADVRAIDDLLAAVARGGAVGDAIALAPPHARPFVRETLAMLAARDEVARAASIFLAGEDPGSHVLRGQAERSASLARYMERRSELAIRDATARQVLEELCGNDVRRWRGARDTAKRGAQARTALFDGVLATLSAAERRP